MHAFKRSLLYLTRKKGKTALLLCILFLLSSLALIALGVRQGASDAARDLRLSFGSTFTLKVRYDKDNTDLWEARDIIVDGEVQSTSFTYRGPMIDQNMVNQVLAIDGVEGMVVDSISHTLYSEALDPAPGIYADGFAEGIDEPDDPYWMKSLDYQVTSNSAIHNAFRTGALEIVEGRHIQPGGKGEVLMSDVLAQRSGLTVGDTYIASERGGLLGPDGDWEKITAGPFEMHIVGIYHIQAEIDPNVVYHVECWMPQNFLFMDTSYETALGTQANIYSTVTFFVEDPKELDHVIDQVEQMDGMNLLRFMVHRDDALYRSSAAPLNTMSFLSVILVLALLIACVFLLYLILSIGVKSRRHEIGVLLSMGVSKAKILGQQMTECLLVFVLAFLLSWGAAGLLASPVGNAILSAVSPPQGTAKPPQYVMLEGYVYDAPSHTPETIEIPVGPKELVSVAVVGCGAIAASIALAGAPILRKKPKDILSSMS